MQRAYNLVPGDYYAVHTTGMAYKDVYFICDDADPDFRIFGVDEPDAVAKYLNGDYRNLGARADDYYCKRYKTKIFESLDYHLTRKTEDHFVKLQEAFASHNAEVNRIKNMGSGQRNQKQMIAMKADNASICKDGPVVGRYYSISSDASFIDAYLICTDVKNEKDLIFGIPSPLKIKEFLKANKAVVIHSGYFAVRPRDEIYTQVGHKAHEASSTDFSSMRNLLMDRLGISADDPRRLFEIIDDGPFPQAPSRDTTASVPTLTRLDDILTKIIADMNVLREEIYR